MAGEDLTGQVAQATGFSSLSWANILPIILWIVGIGLFGYITYTLVRNYVVFKYPIRIDARRGGGVRKSRIGKGGYIMSKGIRTFRIKWGKLQLPWNSKELDFLPDTNDMDTDGRLHFDQLDPDTYVQKRVVHLSRPTRLREVIMKSTYGNYKEGDKILQYEHLIEPLVINGLAEYTEEDKKLNSKMIDVENDAWEPIPRDARQTYINEVASLERTMNFNSLKGMMIMIGAITIILVTGIIVFMFLTKAKSGA